MATPYQSIDPALLALQTAKNTMPASPSTQPVARPSLNVPKQQPQAISTNITPPVAKIGGISSPFGAANINSSPVLGGATPQEIGTRAKELQSLPKTMPQTGTNEDIRSRLSTMGGDIVLRGKGLAEIKSAYPEFAHIDDETFKKIGGDIALRGKGIDDILRDYPQLLQGGSQQLQGGGKAQFSPGGIEQFKPVMPTAPGIYNPLKTLANAPGSLANVGINLANMGLSPKETVKGLLKTIVGATNVVGSAIPKFVLGDEKYNEVNQKLLNDQGTLGQIRRYATEGGEQAKAVGEYFKGYGDLEELQRRVEEDPAGVLSDVATLMGVAGGTIAKVGEVSKLGKVAQIGQKIANLEKYDPYSFIPKAAKSGVVKGGELAGKYGIELLGKATGTSADTIKQIYKSAAAGSDEAQKAMRGAIGDEELLNKVEQGVQAIKDDRSALYGKGYEKLKEIKTPIDIRNIAGDTLKSLYDDLGVRFDAEGNLDFSQSKITSKAAQGNLQSIIDDFKTRENTTPEGLDILKQRVQDYYRGSPEFAKSDRFSTMVSNKIKDEITKLVPEYADMTKQYSEATQLLKDIKSSTAFGGKANTSTVVTKLKSLLRDNQEFRKAMVAKLEEYGGKDILGQVAGTQMSNLLPKGLAGVAQGVMFGAGQLASLASPYTLVPLLLASPRLIGELANATGKSVKFFNDYIEKFKSLVKTDGTIPRTTPNNISTAMIPTSSKVSGGPNTSIKPSGPVKPFPSSPGGNVSNVNNTPVIPPKATVTPSVSAPKVISKQIDDIISEYGKITYKGEVDKIKNLSPDVESKLLKIPGVKQYFESNGIKDRNGLLSFLEKRHKIIREPIETTRKADMAQASKDRFTNGMNQALENAGIKARLPISKANTPVAPKVNAPKPKLGKETLEQNIAKTDDLISEAKKYKTADEFVGSKGKPLYHGTDKKFENFKKPVEGEYGSEANFFSPTEQGADYYRRTDKGEVKKIYLDNDVKVWEREKETNQNDLIKYIEGLNDDDLKRGKEATVKGVKRGTHYIIQDPIIIKYIKNKGFGGFTNLDHTPNGIEETIGIFNPDKIKTEAQLKQIREQANKKSLPPLPKKGK